MFELFSHVGIIVRDMTSALALWRDVFGLVVVDELDVPEERVRTTLLSTGGGYREATCVELIEPYDLEDDTNLFARRLAERGEGVYHLAFRTTDKAAPHERLDHAGIGYLSLPPAAGEVNPRLFIPGPAANGVHIELLIDATPTDPCPR